MNKVKLLFSVLFIAIAVNASAQFGIGLKAGAAFNSVTRSNGGRIDETYHAKTGYDYGLKFTYQINDWFAMRADIEMMSRSHTMKRNLNAVKDIYTDYKNGYINLPVMADFSFGGEKLRGHLLAGGYISYWMTSKVKGKTINIADEFVPFDEKNSFNEYHNRLVAGVVAGPGISYDVTEKITLQLDALIYYDMVSYMKIGEISKDPRYNNTLSITLGATYKL